MAKAKCKVSRSKILNGTKTEIVSLQRCLQEIQCVEATHHDIECPACARRFRDAADRAHIKTLILDRISELNNGGAV